jgi:hypothetical protein
MRNLCVALDPTRRNTQASSFAMTNSLNVGLIGPCRKRDNRREG